MIRLTGIFTVIPATMFLTVSFFVLFAASKTDNAGIMKFGRSVAVLLWISAGLVLLVGLYILITGHHPLIAILTEVCKSCPLHR